MRFLAQAVVIVLVFLALLIEPAVLVAQESFLPEPTGPYLVGTTIRHWIDEARAERYRPSDTALQRSGKRELMVQLWYPADVPVDAELSPYLPGGEVAVQAWNDVIKRFGGEYVMPVAVGETPTHTYVDVPMAAIEGSPFPVLVFSPGLAVPPPVYQAQIEELVSHGYVVAGIFHTYYASATIFPDGQVITGVADLSPSGVVWSEDQRFVLDQLTAINENDPNNVFTGQLDIEKVGVFGMSFGASVSMITMSDDARFQAGVSLDSGYDLARAGEIGRPILFAYSEGVTITDNETSQLQQDAFLLRFDGFQHATFSDCPLLPGNEDTSGVVHCSADPARAIPMLNAYILGFFDKYLKGETVPLFDGPSPDYPEVEFYAAGGE